MENTEVLMAAELAVKEALVPVICANNNAILHEPSKT